MEDKAKLASFFVIHIVEMEQKLNKWLEDIKDINIPHKGVWNIGEEMQKALLSTSAQEFIC